MILTAIMNVLKAFILFIISLIPTIPDLSGLASLLKPFFDVFKNLNSFINIPVVFTCFLAILITYDVKLIWGIIMWIVRKIPGVT